MTWLGPLWKGPNTRTAWGYTYELTDDHPSKEELQPLKFTYDRLAEDALLKLNEICPPKGTLPRNSDVKATKPVKDTLQDDASTKPPDLKSVVQRDLYALLKEHAHSDESLSTLWAEVTTVPDWVDWDQIQRGQDVFYRYGGPALTGLTYQSLLGGMGAARVVETLARTGGFAPKVARRRLLETTQHILQCTQSLESIKPNGAGFQASIRVRLLHAAVRQRIMAMRATRPDYYDLEQWGVPINDLDCIGTIATFSSTLIWISLPRQGIFLRKQETEDYLALWRYVAYLMGTPHETFASPSKAKAIVETLLLHEVQPSETSKILANNVIICLQGQPPAFASAEMLTASARWLNGNDLADKLALPRPSLYYSALMAGQCLFFMFMCYTARSISYLDRRKIAWLKRLYYELVVKSKVGLGGVETLFELKYIPQYETITNMGEVGQPGKWSKIERKNLQTLVIAFGGLALVSWGLLKLVFAIAGLGARY
ncbi:hypothetical protein EJ05DRAFT_197550 [Pseudovirgaria hyperparasitica]|uniref:ER-bound oxygenase mpaB/mpaB'/Rubber oxygenase catalytic domain-containing protein n=1 Tax=Pseudovirgaria hyperparasitica TaxID=470096 RepID=A0A6A6WIK3_9PEZI|nr:uncharacterized protein EJ05DRAFT_197550 [Pseudovirgaria hyperparasitica]KAF2762109.1 hypothetical protein EJ05DRAFT_197550 [Pseudovirgaria hyperparasitica]